MTMNKLFLSVLAFLIALTSAVDVQAQSRKKSRIRTKQIFEVEAFMPPPSVLTPAQIRAEKARQEREAELWERRNFEEGRERDRRDWQNRQQGQSVLGQLAVAQMRTNQDRRGTAITGLAAVVAQRAGIDPGTGALVGNAAYEFGAPAWRQHRAAQKEKAERERQAKLEREQAVTAQTGSDAQLTAVLAELRATREQNERLIAELHIQRTGGSTSTPPSPRKDTVAQNNERDAPELPDFEEEDEEDVLSEP